MLGPDVAQKMRRDHARFGSGNIAVNINQLIADIAMKRIVQGLYLVPKPVGLGGKLFTGHIIAALPDFADVFKTKLLGTGIANLDHPRIVVLHRRGDGAPTLPDIQEFIGITGRCHNPDNVNIGQAFPVFRAILTVRIGAAQTGGNFR